jgi:hypothetical protein
MQMVQDEHEKVWDPEEHRIRCLGHIINLIVQAFLFAGSSTQLSLEDLEISDDQEEGEEGQISVVRPSQMRAIGPMGKLHNIVVHIRGSASRTKEFLSIANRMIPMDNRTRWNSWYKMISIAIKLEKEVDFYMKNYPDLKDDALEQTDWESLRATANFLRDFKDLCYDNEGDGKTISNSLPSLLIIYFRTQAFLKQHRTKANRGDFDRDCTIRGESTLKAWQKWWDILWDHPLYLMAVILHPTYRTKWFENAMRMLKMSPTKQKEKLRQVRQIWLDRSSTFPAELFDKNTGKGKGKEKERRDTAFFVQQAKGRTIENFHERYFEDWEPAEVIDEYDVYITEPTVKDIKDPLEWWQSPVRQKRWPRLSLLAMEILSFPPMSDEAERVFSGGRRTISWERARLNPETIEAIECLQHWLSQKARTSQE